MKSILDPSFMYTPSVGTDLTKTFKRVWSELEEREKARGAAASRPSKLRLQCTNELVGIGEVELAGLLTAQPGSEPIRFVCPRCHQQHESLRFS